MNALARRRDRTPRLQRQARAGPAGAGELRVDGKSAGKLAGFARSKDGWRRVAALVLAIPMLPLPLVGPAPPDAAPEIVAPSPPPPPPPPPSH